MRDIASNSFFPCMVSHHESIPLHNLFQTEFLPPSAREWLSFYVYHLNFSIVRGYVRWKIQRAESSVVALIMVCAIHVFGLYKEDDGFKYYISTQTTVIHPFNCSDSSCSHVLKQLVWIFFHWGDYTPKAGNEGKGGAAWTKPSANPVTACWN